MEGWEKGWWGRKTDEGKERTDRVDRGGIEKGKEGKDRVGR